jgi:hypothetical protein
MAVPSRIGAAHEDAGVGGDHDALAAAEEGSNVNACRARPAIRSPSSLRRQPLRTRSTLLIVDVAMLLEGLAILTPGLVAVQAIASIVGGLVEITDGVETLGS